MVGVTFVTNVILKSKESMQRKEKKQQRNGECFNDI